MCKEKVKKRFWEHFFTLNCSTVKLLSCHLPIHVLQEKVSLGKVAPVIGRRGRINRCVRIQFLAAWARLFRTKQTKKEPACSVLEQAGVPIDRVIERLFRQRVNIVISLCILRHERVVKNVPIPLVYRFLVRVLM